RACSRGCTARPPAVRARSRSEMPVSCARGPHAPPPLRVQFARYPETRSRCPAGAAATMIRESSRSRVHLLVSALLGPALATTPACTGDDGDQGPPGPPGPVGTDNELTQGDPLPGLHIAVQTLTGGTASGGRFRVGDKLKVNFRLQKDDGSDWDIAELS